MTIYANIEVSSNIKRADINIVAIANAIVTAKKRLDANIAATASKLTKKRANIKVMVLVNKMTIANVNKLASNTKKANVNIVVTADVNVTAAINKATSKAKKMPANVTVNSNNSNARRTRTNKIAKVDKNNARNA